MLGSFNKAHKKFGIGTFLFKKINIVGLSQFFNVKYVRICTKTCGCLRSLEFLHDLWNVRFVILFPVSKRPSSVDLAPALLIHSLILHCGFENLSRHGIGCCFVAIPLVHSRWSLFIPCTVQAMPCKLHPFLLPAMSEASTIYNVLAHFFGKTL